jgi:regulator of protease activity HflC (stomatin/prohibitin superfamily)
MNLFLLVSLILVVAGAALAVQGTQTERGSVRSLGVALVLVGIVAAGLSRAFVVVPAGNTGVVFNIFGGVQENELGEGFHIVLPVLQQVTLYDVRQQELTLARETNDQVTARSSEGLEINVDATILYQVDPRNAARLHQDIGPSYEVVRVRPEVRSQIRDAIGQYAAADLISTQRTDLQLSVEESLRTALDNDNILVLAVLMRDIRIPTTITNAIEEKQAAEQQVEVEENRRRQAEISAQRRVIEAQGERDAEIARAEGQAEALSLRGQAIRENPEIIDLEVAQRLAPGIQTIMIPSDNNFLLDLRSLSEQRSSGTSGTSSTTPSTAPAAP